MFWGYIKISVERDIVVIDGNVISANYCKLLETHLMENNYLGDIFQQDNASWNISKFSTNFFQENGFQVSENWPPQSPDLNINENLWKYMKQKIRKNTLHQLNLFVKFLKLFFGNSGRLHSSVISEHSS